MNSLPPPIRRRDFAALDDPRTNIEQYFAPIVDQLREFLNATEPLTRIQEVRGLRPGGRAFVLGARIETKHWWFSHHGGRSEAQWNIGMFPTHIRFGIGFNRTGAGFADVSAVERHLSCFLEALQRLVTTQGALASMGLWTETYNRREGELHTAPADKLLSPGRTDREDWIFVGRLLASGAYGAESDDSVILENPRALAEELTHVAKLLWNPWKETMACARKGR